MELFISYKNKRPVAERLHQPIKVQLYTYSCAETVPYSALVTQPRKFIFVINYTYTHTHTRARAHTHTHTQNSRWISPTKIPLLTRIRSQSFYCEINVTKLRNDSTLRTYV